MKFVHRISMWRYAHAGETLPRGYGIAWVDYYSDRAVCLPVPLHIIASFVRMTWQKFRVWRAPDLLLAEYSRGREEGYAAGYKSGREHGDRFGAYVERIVSMEEFAADPHKFIGRSES